MRDWLYVEDHCEAIARVLQQAPPGSTYNIGGEAEVDNLTLVERLCDLMDTLGTNLPQTSARSLITFVKDRPGHDRRYAMDITRLRQDLGWQPTVTLDQGLERTITWYLNHPHWWQPLLTPAYQATYAQIYG